MTKPELLSFVRTLMDDKTEPYLASSADINLFIDEAEKEAAERALYLRTDRAFNIKVIAAKASYEFSSAIIFVNRVKLMGQERPLKKTTQAELDFEIGNWEERTGTPTHYFLDGNKVTLFPVPDSAFILQFDASRRPVECMETPESFHESLAFWCLYRCYSIPDSDLFNPKESELNLQKFTDVFGHKRRAGFDKNWADLTKKTAFPSSPF